MVDCNPTSRKWLAYAGLLLLTLWVSATAVRIEILNHRMDGILPLSPVVPGEGSQKWRVGSPSAIERGMRIEFQADRGLPYDPDAAEAMELTEHEQAEFGQHLLRNQKNSRLRSLVYGPGMLQYPLVPLGIGLAIVLWPGRSTGLRILLGMCIMFCATAGVLAFYREYAQAAMR